MDCFGAEVGWQHLEGIGKQLFFLAFRISGVKKQALEIVNNVYRRLVSSSDLRWI